MTDEAFSRAGNSRAPSAQPRDLHVLALAVELREAKRRRKRIFPGVPLGNPTWETMLDLFIDELNGLRVSLNELARTGDLPAPTVYDSIDVLERFGLVTRTPDPYESRVLWLGLTVTARQGLYEIFEQSAETVRPIEFAG